MVRRVGTCRRLLLGMAIASLLWGCQSTQVFDVPISSKSTLLSVDVAFPTPRGRDPSLVRAFLVKGPISGGMEELPEFIEASFVKKSRAYWLDPEPGTYSLVAVTSAVAAPVSHFAVDGVEKTTLPDTIANAVIFPTKLIQRTRTTVRPGTVEFMGALRIRTGERINADVQFEDLLQRRIADRLRPGASSEGGIGGWFTRAYTVDLEETSISNHMGDWEEFLYDAMDDLGESPWAQVAVRGFDAEAPEPLTQPSPWTPEPSHTASPADPIPEPVAAVAVPDPIAAEPEPAVAVPDPIVAEPEPAIAVPETTAQSPVSEPESAPAEPELVPAEPAAEPPEPVVLAATPRVEAPQPRRAPAPPEPTVARPRPPAPEQRFAARRPRPPAPAPERHRFPDLPASSPLAEILSGMSYEEVQEILGAPDERMDRTTAKAWIPFYTGPGAFLRDWVYTGEGRVTFSIDDGKLEVIDVVHDPNAGK